MPACSSPRLGPATWGHFSWSSTSPSAEIRKVLAGRLFKNDSERERLYIPARLPTIIQASLPMKEFEWRPT
jgi:hypothetical protein